MSLERIGNMYDPDFTFLGVEKCDLSKANVDIFSILGNFQNFSAFSDLRALSSPTNSKYGITTPSL